MRVSRASIAQRLADLVDDDEVLSETVVYLEAAKRAKRGGQVRWHLDDDGRVQLVDCAGTLYRRKAKT